MNENENTTTPNVWDSYLLKVPWSRAIRDMPIAFKGVS